MAAGSGGAWRTQLRTQTRQNAMTLVGIARQGAGSKSPEMLTDCYEIELRATKASDFLFTPTGYVSNTALSDSAIYDTSTFASLGVTPGT
jgi:hypothetical protein